MKELYEKLANSSPKLQRGLVQCRICKKIKKVDSDDCLLRGWPKCHNETMTLDVEV